jgi:hypothetical protein
MGRGMASRTIGASCPKRYNAVDTGGSDHRDFSLDLRHVALPRARESPLAKTLPPCRGGLWYSALRLARAAARQRERPAFAGLSSNAVLVPSSDQNGIP